MDNKLLIKEMMEQELTLPSNNVGHFKTYKVLTVPQIYNLIMQCAQFSKLDFEYSTEPLYYIMRDARVTLVSATAGAGKTTLTCMKVDREIRFRGENPRSICMLSFNNDSVKDIKNKMLRTLNNNNLVTRRFGIIVDESDMPNIRSLNSLTYNLVDQFKQYWHLARVDIISNDEANILMSKTLKSFAVDNPNILVKEDLISNCLAIYDLCNETRKKIPELKNLSAVIDTGLDLVTLDQIITSYRDRLHILGKFHHSDTTRLVLERCDVDPEFKNCIENLYDLIVVDELQDISESVFQLLKIMVNTKNRLIAIGDGDQSIYGFKGARPDTCFKFKNDFPDAELCTLSVNRRCSENILNYAKAVISNVHKRVPQDLAAIRDGGLVDINHYEESSKAIATIANYLDTIPKDKLGRICIGFRKNVTCYYIAQKLMEYGIPFRVRSDMMPGADKLSQHLKAILAILKNPSNLSLALQHLYKILPIKKLSEKEQKKFLVDIEEYFDENDLEYWYEIPSDMFQSRNHNDTEIKETLERLETASSLVRRKGTMKEIMDIIFPLFEKHYWNFTRAVSAFQPELESMVLDIYSANETYVEFQHRKKQMEDNIQRYISRGYGVKLSSFHSLKGLEFDEVFLVELDSKNLPLIRCSDNATEEEVMGLVDEELRLFYVAVTRARDKLHLYWSSLQPSTFDSINKDFEDSQTSTNEELDLNFSLTDDVDINLDLDFSLDSDRDTSDSNTVANLNPDLELNFSLESKHESEENLIQIKEIPKIPIIKQTYDFSSLESDLEDKGLEETIHLREDFVDIKNGDELQNILGFICNVINAEEVSKP